MDINTALQLVTRGIFLLLGLLTLVDFIRYRGQARLDVALAFNSLAIPVVVGLVTDFTGFQSRLVSVLSSIALMTQPYLLVRVIAHFQRAPKAIHVASWAGIALSSVVLITSESPLPLSATLVVVAYFVVIEGYAAVAIIRGVVVSTGITRKRLTLAAVGTSLLGAIFLLAGVLALLPDLADAASTVLQLVAVASGIAFYLGFAPPRALRHAWQLGELHRFLRDAAGRPATGQTADLLEYLSQAAIRAVGGKSASTAMWDERTQELVLAESDKGSPLAGDGVIERAWRERKPAMAYHPRGFGVEGIRIRAQASGGANVLYAIPITTSRQSWGVLLVTKRGVLFPDDDLELLALLAEQTAIALENAGLLAQRQTMVERLQVEVAERRKAEAKVRKLNKDLERRAAELEAANKELEAFTYSVSHDLRAPLRSLSGFSRILLEKHAPELSEKAQGYLQYLNEDARQMGALIDDLLAFSRLSRQPLKKARVLPTQVVQDALEDLHAEHENRHIDIAIGELPDCMADPALLKLVYVNLLSNALKYSRKRDVPRIEIGHKKDGDERVYFVKDNGVGFDMRYADKLFSVFQRLHLPEEYEGTGVGLAIVQRIVHRHGGRVWCDARPDAGATFFFTLEGGNSDG